MADRYFYPHIISDTSLPVTLDGDEAHHLIKVMRIHEGDNVIIFNGTGWEYHTLVVKVEKLRISLQILSASNVNRESSLKLTLGVALPKGDRQRWLVEKAVELGVTSLVPLECERSVAHASTGGTLRLERTILEACKQCGRNMLMRLEPAQSWEQFIARNAAPPNLAPCQDTDSPRSESVPDSDESLFFIAEPGGMAFHEFITPSLRNLVVGIGPEGGLSPAEVELAMLKKWKSCSLGKRILRTETAAVAVAAACSWFF